MGNKDMETARIIREAREKKGLTQMELAAIWPKSRGKGVGVDWHYVQAVEYGLKRIVDRDTLRGLCDLLSIEYWRFGLSEYDPHSPNKLPKHKRLVDETLDFAEYSIRRFEDTYVHAYLARMYGTTGDAYRFEQTINTALNLAPNNYGDGTDFVHHPLSGILAEKSYGFIDLGQPEKTLALREEIEEQTKKDHNNRLAAWIHLDWAKAYSMQGKIEESVKEGRDFYVKALARQEPHILTRAKRFANELMRKHSEVQVVRDFCEEVNTAGERY